MEKQREMHLAVLIDAENVPHGNIKGIMQEIATHGIPTIKRIYTDWTDKKSDRWKTVLLDLSITPIQQYSYTTGKNASDSAMIIDAMDILYSNNVGGFCIISSDSDFTRLAVRLREAGKKVIGIGEKKTPQPFIASCDTFVFIEILSPAKDTEVKADKSKPASKAASAMPAISEVDEQLTSLIDKCILEMGDEQGWVFLSKIMVFLTKNLPQFDPRNYGFRKISPLLKSIGKYEVEERDSENPNIKLVYVRIKPSK